MLKHNDGAMAHIPEAGKLAFSAEPYVHNWYEETVRNTLKREDFLNRRECEELSIQKSQVMTDLLLKPVRLTARGDGYVYFGDVLQIISPGPDCRAAIEAYPFKRYCALGQQALSAAVPPTVIDYAPYLNTDSIISASPHLFPVVRNSFVIERPDCPEDNKTVLHFGQPFRIRALPTQHWTLYIHSAPATPLHAAAIHSGKPLVRFSDTANPNTLFRAIPLDTPSKMRMTLGVPVPLKTRMLIQHAISGNNLSIEPDHPVLTYFGDESEVTVHTKRDRVRRPSWANHWSFDTERGWAKPDLDVMDQAKYSAAINANDATRSASDAAKAEAEEEAGDDGADDDQEEGENEQQPYASQPTQSIQAFEANQLSEEMRKMRMDTAVAGHVMAFDPTTAPQPHAHEYRLSENQEFYPNKKWNCEGNMGCYPRPPTTRHPKVCPPPPKENCFNTEDPY